MNQRLEAIVVQPVLLARTGLTGVGDLPPLYTTEEEAIADKNNYLQRNYKKN